MWSILKNLYKNEKCQAMSSKFAVESGVQRESEVLGKDGDDGVLSDRDSDKGFPSETRETSFHGDSDQANEEVEVDQILQPDESRHEKLALFSARLCQHHWFQIVFLCVSVVHNVYMVVREETRYLGAASFDLDILFASLYLVQTLFMVASCRFTSLMRESIFNRLDFVAMISTWIQIAGRSQGINFTLCSLRLLRLLLLGLPSVVISSPGFPL